MSREVKIKNQQMFGKLNHPHVSVNNIDNNKNIKYIQRFIECQKRNLKYIHTLEDYLSDLKHNKTFSHFNVNKPLKYCSH